MNAPYDGDRGRGANGDPNGPVPPTPPLPADQDPYVQDAYRNDPHRAQDPTAQDPVAEAFYDRAAHPPPDQPTQPLYPQPAAGRHTPDPQLWASPPPPEPHGPSRNLPYGDAAATTQFMGVDDLMTQAAQDHPEPDAFAHLYRDQQHYEPQHPAAPAAPGPEAVPQQPVPEPEPAPWRRPASRPVAVPPACSSPAR